MNITVTTYAANSNCGGTVVHTMLVSSGMCRSVGDASVITTCELDGIYTAEYGSADCTGAMANPSGSRDRLSNGVCNGADTSYPYMMRCEPGAASVQPPLSPPPVAPAPASPRPVPSPVAPSAAAPASPRPVPSPVAPSAATSFITFATYEQGDHTCAGEANHTLVYAEGTCRPLGGAVSASYSCEEGTVVEALYSTSACMGPVERPQVTHVSGACIDVAFPYRITCTSPTVLPPPAAAPALSSPAGVPPSSSLAGVPPSRPSIGHFEPTTSDESTAGDILRRDVAIFFESAIVTLSLPGFVATCSGAVLLLLLTSLLCCRRVRICFFRLCCCSGGTEDSSKFRGSLPRWSVSGPTSVKHVAGSSNGVYIAEHVPGKGMQPGKTQQIGVQLGQTEPRRPPPIPSFASI